jgi:hypothetical protein
MTAKNTLDRFLPLAILSPKDNYIKENKKWLPKRVKPDP